MNEWIQPLWRFIIVSYLSVAHLILPAQLLWPSYSGWSLQPAQSDPVTHGFIRHYKDGPWRIARPASGRKEETAFIPHSFMLYAIVMNKVQGKLLPRLQVDMGEGRIFGISPISSSAIVGRHLRTALASVLWEPIELPSYSLGSVQVQKL